MPVLAIPYLVPFANAAGIVIGSVASAVGLIALSDKVQDYMEENPENSMKILAMIMPEQGIAALFNKEAGDEVEGEVEVEVEEKPKKLSGKEKGERIKAAIKRARGKKGLQARGNYSSPDAEGPAVDIRGSVIREVEDMGIADKGLKDKPYKKSGFNYKKYFRKADGGRIGFEVGGLSSRAQSIYDSWIAAGHTEEDVLAYLTSQGLYGDQEATGIETIVNTAPTVGGDGDFKGGGKWGNLDLSKSKTFNKNVFKTVGPVKGWDMTEIEGFYNPKTGQYQTLEGQNIEHGGYFTGEPKEGDIEGTPIDWSSIPMGAWGLGMKAFKGIQNAWQKKQAEGILEAAAERQAKAIELHEAKQAQKAADAAAGAFTNTVQLDPGGGGGPGSPGSWHGQTAAKERQGQQVAGPGFGQGAYFDKGGLATMFQRRR